MSETESENQAPQEPPTSERDGDYAVLENLLAEVNALAHRLNQVGRGQVQGRQPSAAHQVLLALHRNGLQSVPELARTRCTSRQNIQILMDRLEKQGCVAPAENPSHKRSPLFGLSGRGREMLNAGQAGYADLIVSLASRGAESQIAQAARLLRSLRLALSPEGELPSKAVSPGKRSPQLAPSSKVTEPESSETPGTPSETAEEEIPLSLL